MRLTKNLFDKLSPCSGFVLGFSAILKEAIATKNTRELEAAFSHIRRSAQEAFYEAVKAAAEDKSGTVEPALVVKFMVETMGCDPKAEFYRMVDNRGDVVTVSAISIAKENAILLAMLEKLAASKNKEQLR